MLTISICDDNMQFALALSNHIRQYCALSLPERIECKITPAFGSASELLNYLEQYSIDILFLDIDMPRMNGFETAEIINQRYPNTIIIFVSAHNNFVYSSFDYNPFRFLRKSHLKEELPHALNKAINKCILDSESVTLKTTEGIQVIRLNDIMYIESCKNYYTIYCASGSEYKCRGTLATAEETLKEFDFFRIHAAYIINFDYIDSIKNNNLTVKNGVILPISNQKHNNFFEKYLSYSRRKMFR